MRLRPRDGCGERPVVRGWFRPPVPPNIVGMSDRSTDPSSRAVNASPWSIALGHDQAHRLVRPDVILVIGGQRPVDDLGRLMHAGDVAAQVALTLDNVTAVVRAARLDLRDIVHLRISATGRDALRDACDVVREHLAEHDLRTPVTTVAVAGLGMVGMEIEIDGLAIREQRQPEGTSS